MENRGCYVCEKMMLHVPDRRSSRRRTLLSSEERTTLPSPNSGENRSSKATDGTSKAEAEAATAHKHANVAAASKTVSETLAFAAMAARTAELLRCSQPLASVSSLPSSLSLPLPRLCTGRRRRLSIRSQNPPRVSCPGLKANDLGLLYTRRGLAILAGARSRGKGD